MDWLKDKKNTPFVIGGAVVLIVASIAFTLFKMNVFTPSAATPTALPEPTTVAARPGGPGPGGPPPGPGAGPAAPRPLAPASPAGGPGGPKVAARPHPGPGGPGKAAAPTGAAALLAAAGVVTVPPVNPATAKDPFNIANAATPSQKRIIKRSFIKVVTNIGNALNLRHVLPQRDIYSYSSDQIKNIVLNPPIPDNGLPPVGVPDAGNGNGQGTTLPRVAGILNDDSGVFAIIEANGTDPSQSVKPGDTISGGYRVTSIQSDGITVVSPGGRSINIPVTSGPPGGSPNGGMTPYGGPPPPQPTDGGGPPPPQNF